jgi:hypothetical protein
MRQRDRLWFQGWNVERRQPRDEHRGRELGGFHGHAELEHSRLEGNSAERSGRGISERHTGSHDSSWIEGEHRRQLGAAGVSRDAGRGHACSWQRRFW